MTTFFSSIWNKVFAPAKDHAYVRELFSSIDSLEALFKAVYSQTGEDRIKGCGSVLSNYEKNIMELSEELSATIPESADRRVIVNACAVIMAHHPLFEGLDAFTDDFHSLVLDNKTQLEEIGRFPEVEDVGLRLIKKCQDYLAGLSLLALGTVLISTLAEEFDIQP